MSTFVVLSVALCTIILVILESSITYTDKIQYEDIRYGLTLSLPSTWRGYTVLNENWTGNIIDSPTNEKIIGPEIIIRHPLWTAESPRQDIPIMILTQKEWSLIWDNKLAIGAAPIGPSKLYSNDNYVFAIPARYNYAFPTGFEEVDQIIESQRR